MPDVFEFYHVAFMVNAHPHLCQRFFLRTVAAGEMEKFSAPPRERVLSSDDEIFFIQPCFFLSSGPSSLYHVFMKDILNKANELGLLIRETDQYRDFREAAQELEEDPASKKLLEEFSRMSGEMKAREQAGDIIENFERDELHALGEEISHNEIILGYLEARDGYIALLEGVQRALGEESTPDDLT